MSIAGTFVLLVLGMVIHVFSKRKIGLPALYTLLLVLIVAAPVVQSMFIASKFPVERAALAYMIMFPLALFHGAEELAGRRGVVGGVVQSILVVSAIACISHFLKNASIQSNYTWPYDSKNKDMLAYLENEWNATEGSAPLSFTSHWLFEPSFNYYRALAYNNTFQKLDRTPWRNLSPDYVYTFTWDIHQTDMQTYSEVFCFPEINTVLLKRRADMDGKEANAP